MRLFLPFRRRREHHAALAEELATHLEELTHELIQAGHTAAEARYQARRQFGNQTALLEQSRQVWRMQWLDTLLRDLHFTWRLSRRQPWIVAAIIASIAIGVGANTAITSVLDTVLLNPLGIRNAAHILAATVHLHKLQMYEAQTSAAELRDLQYHPNLFSAVTATEQRTWTLQQGGQPSRLIGLAVTPEFFQIFDTRPILGGFWNGADPNTILLSHALWQNLFGSDPAVLGRKLLLDGKPFRVTGVAAADFHFPANANAWVPLLLPPNRYSRGNNMNLSLFARLRSGVSRQQAQQQINRYIANLSASPEGADFRNLDYGIDLRPLSQHIAGDLRRPLLLLWSAALVLLIAACANVAGLLLARGSSRRKEVAIRISLGAGKLQILRQLLTESVVLALLGGAAGLLIAAASLQLLKQKSVPFQDVLLLVGLNGHLLLYGLGLALLSSVVFGLVPALQLMKDQQVSAMARTRRKWFQNIYIVGQVGAAMLLLLVTGLLLQSLKAIASLQTGFDTQNLTTAFLIKPEARQYPFFDRVLATLRSTAGVQSAALAYSIPFGGDTPTSLFSIKGRQHQPGQPEWHAEAYQVTPDYFQTLHISLLRGRLISDLDTAQSPLVCVIDSGLAKRFFPNQDPIGQSVAIYSGWARIVGVVSAVRDATLESASRPAAYYSLAQVPYFPIVGILVRSPFPAAAAIRSAIHEADPNVAAFDFQTMEQRVDASLATRSIIAWLVTVFAAISMLLAAVGIHGVLAQIVTERTAEIGIRMALGARGADIFHRYLLHGLGLSLLGIGMGLCAATLSRHWLETFLYQIKPLDSATVLLGASGILAISAAAVLAPAWRASHIDPQIALRTE